MSHASPEDWALIWGSDVSSTDEADPGRAIIEAFWRREFSIMPAINRALEIGAGGSAAVAKLMSECFANTEIIASDFRAVPTLPGAIAYVGNASLEAMPFADGDFDLIAGQFVFEYANAQKASAELSRILRSGGSLKLLVHHAESNFSVTLPHRERCLQAGVILYRALNTTDAFLRKVRIRAALKQITTLIAFSRQQGPLFSNVLGDLMDFSQIAQTRLGGAKSSTESVLALCEPCLRLTRAQTAATLSEPQIAERLSMLQGAGFHSTEIAELCVGGRPLAWTVSAQR